MGIQSSFFAGTKKGALDNLPPEDFGRWLRDRSAFFVSLSYYIDFEEIVRHASATMLSLATE